MIRNAHVRLSELQQLVFFSLQEMRIRLPHRINVERPRDDCGKQKESSVINPQVEVSITFESIRFIFLL